MELVKLTVLVPAGHERAIAEMVRSQVEAIITQTTGTENATLLAGRLSVARETTEARRLPDTVEEAVAVLAPLAEQKGGADDSPQA